MKILTTLAGAGVALVVAGSATAATVTYTDRTTFNVAASPTLFEDFNGFVADTNFVPAPVVAGFMTVSGSAGATTAFGNNKVDVPPQDSQVDVDGTASLNVFTQAGVSVFLTFSQALTGWGADFHAFNDDAHRTLIFVDGVEVTTELVAGNDTRFFGFVSDTAFTTLEFRGVQNDVFGVDNVAGAAVAVPEPTTWALMILGFGAAGASLRRRRVAHA